LYQMQHYSTFPQFHQRYIYLLLDNGVDCYFFMSLASRKKAMNYIERQVRSGQQRSWAFHRFVFHRTVQYHAGYEYRRSLQS